MKSLKAEDKKIKDTWLRILSSYPSWEYASETAKESFRKKLDEATTEKDFNALYIEVVDYYYSRD